MVKYSVHDLDHLGVRFDDRQMESFAHPDEVVGWMVPWPLPDPIQLGSGEGFETAVARDPATGEHHEVIWPRLIQRPWDQEDAEAEMAAAYHHDEYWEWDTLPQVVGYTGHEECDAYGCCHEEYPGLIGVWAAEPLTVAEARELEYAVMSGLHYGIWSPLVEIFQFEERCELSVPEMWEITTGKIPDGLTAGQRELLHKQAETATYYLEEYIALAHNLNIDPTEPPNRDDFQFITADFTLELSPELHNLWDRFRSRISRTRQHLKDMFPELAYYIEWSSLW